MNIKLDLTEDEVNLILTGLAQLQYARVVKLIEGIAAAAKAQLQPPDPPKEP